MFCEESLGKIQFLELFQNVSVHEFYRLKELITLEQVNTSYWVFFSKTATEGVVNFYWMQMSWDEHLVEI